MNKKRFPILVMMLAFMLFGLSDCDTECCESQRFASVSGSESKITLHFNANGGRAKMKDMIIDPDKDIVLPLCTFIPPDGKKFAHWNIMPNDSGNITLADGGTFNMSQIPDSIRSQLSVTEITLYAIWTNETVVYKYTVSFDANGGSGTMADMTADDGQSVALPLCTFTPPAGKKFGHWNITADDSGMIKLPDGAAIDSLMSLPVTRFKLYAIWIDEDAAPIVYTIHFDANGGSGAMSDMTADSSQSIALPLCSFTPPTGKRFGHWNINANDSGLIKLPDGASAKSLILLPVTDIRLYAIWISNGEHSVFYNDPKNAANPNLSIFNENEAFELKDLTADGWTFDGWFDASADGAKVTGWSAGERNADVTLYARWTVNVYNITYKDQGGADFSGVHGVDYPTTHTYNEATNLVVPTKQHYDFGGWHFTADCSDENVSVLAANDITSDITLYAKWSVLTYPITYNNMFNGTHSNPSSFTVEDDVSLENAVRDGYTFGGWYDAADGGNKVTEWYAGDVASGISLWARWTAKRYHITFVSDGNISGDASVTATFDEVLPSLQTCPSKIGYDFGGYWTAANGTGVQYIDSEGNGCKKWDLTSDTTLTAFFLDHGTHQIVYINNINNAANPNPTAFVEDVNISLANLSSSGLIFWGWYDAESGGKKVSGWNAGEQTGNITLYAMWNGITDEGDIMIMNEICTKTGLKQVLSESTTIIGSGSEGAFISGRTVTLSPYSIGKYEVTQQLYKAVMGTNPSYYKEVGFPLGTKGAIKETNCMFRPVDRVSWYKVIAFCNKLSLMLGKTPCYTVSGITDWTELTYDKIPYLLTDEWNAAACDWTADGFRLPTWCEWECAARGGVYSTGTPWTYRYSGSSTCDDVAWTDDNAQSGGKVHSWEVGLKAPNSLGVYDMSGNVEEWLWDVGGGIDANTPITGPANSGGLRRQSGGCIDDLARFCKVTSGSAETASSGGNFGFGFRLAQSIVE